MADNFEYSAAVSSLIFREFLARVQPGTGYKIVDSTEYRNAFDPHARVAKIFRSVGTLIFRQFFTRYNGNHWFARA